MSHVISKHPRGEYLQIYWLGWLANGMAEIIKAETLEGAREIARERLWDFAEENNGKYVSNDITRMWLVAAMRRENISVAAGGKEDDRERQR